MSYSKDIWQEEREKDQAPLEEPTFEEEMEWEEIRRRQAELRSAENSRCHAELQADIERERFERLFFLVRDTLTDGGMPAGRATHFASIVAKSYTEKP